MDPLLSTALEAAEAAARVHLLHFGEVGMEGAREKAHSDFVTVVDLEAQEAALSVILQRYSHHRVLAEEDTGGGSGEDTGEGSGGGSGEGSEEGSGEGSGGGSGGGSGEGAGGGSERAWPEDGGFLWIVDPLDGTTNYLHRHPHFAASVGVGRWIREEEDEAGPGPRAILEAGAVVAARTGERWWARRGQGAFKNGLPIQVSSLRSMRTALIGTGFPFKEPDLVPRYLQEFQRVLPASGGVRRGGSAALDLCYLAEGILDGFWEEDYLSPWDVAAGLVILQEAGGLATRLDGSEIDLENGSILAANSPDILQELGALVRGR